MTKTLSLFKQKDNKNTAVQELKTCLGFVEFSTLEGKL